MDNCTSQPTVTRDILYNGLEDVESLCGLLTAISALANHASSTAGLDQMECIGLHTLAKHTVDVADRVSEMWKHALKASSSKGDAA